MKHITVPNMDEDKINFRELIYQLSENYNVKYSEICSIKDLLDDFIEDEAQLREHIIYFLEAEINCDDLNLIKMMFENNLKSLSKDNFSIILLDGFYKITSNEEVKKIESEIIENIFKKDIEQLMDKLNSNMGGGIAGGHLAGPSLNIDQNNFNKLKSVEVSIEANDLVVERYER